MMKNIFLLACCCIGLPAHAAESAVGLKKVQSYVRDLDKLSVWFAEPDRDELDLLESKLEECKSTIKTNGITRDSTQKLIELKNSTTNFLNHCDRNDYKKKAHDIIDYCNAKLSPTLRGMSGYFEYSFKKIVNDDK